MSLAEDIEYEADAFMESYHKMRNSKYWITKDVKKLKIKDMGLAHMKNCINKFGEKFVPYRMLERVINDERIK